MPYADTPFDLSGNVALVTGAYRNRALIDNAEFNAWVCKRTPAGRWGEPEKIAGARRISCLEGCRLHDHQIVFLDGGMSVAL